MDQQAAGSGQAVELGGSENKSSSVSRRTLIGRAVAAGGLVWAAPAITTLARARAAGTPPPTTTIDSTPHPLECSCTFCATVDTPTGTLYYSCGPSTSEECDCLCKCAGKAASCSHEDPCAVGVICTPTANNEPCQ